MLSPKLIAAALLWLCPTGSISSKDAATAAAGLKYYDRPLLAVAVIVAESRCNKDAMSHTNDYGLAQLHVSRTTNTSYVGRERSLLNVRRNIRIQRSMLRLWKSYHKRKCRSGRHHWVSHYNQGGIVRSLRYERKVLRLLRKLKGWLKIAQDRNNGAV